MHGDPLTEWTVDFVSGDPRNKVCLSNGMANFVAGAAASEELDLPTRVGKNKRRRGMGESQHYL